MKTWRTRVLLFVLFFTSLSSLVYELVWTRKLSLTFGTSALAVSTVLSVFMAGLAFGSYFGGKLIERSQRPYRFLALLQLLIGVSCLVTLSLIDGIKYLYLFLFNIFGEVNFLFNIAQFILSTLILFLPTFLIGSAFPTIVKLYYHERKAVGESVSTCYAVDTLGSALGVLLVGFYSIWTIGLFKTSLVASVINILMGLLVVASFGRADNTREGRVAPAAGTHPITDRLILVLFFFSGFAALMLENVWIRFFDLIYGNSIISFSIVVASFLMGLGLGSFLAQFLLLRIRDSIFLFGLIELLIGMSSLVVLLVFPYLESVFLAVFFSVRQYSWFIGLLGMSSILTLMAPTCLMGMTLPVLSTVYVDGKTIGSDVGRLFAVNSFGAILGSFLTGFVFVYFLGLNNTAILAALIYISIAVVFVTVYKKSRVKSILGYLAATALGVLGLFHFFFQEDYLYNGAYYHGVKFRNEREYFEHKRHSIPLFVKQSPYSFVSVVESSGVIYVKINGRSEASVYDSTQYLLAHLPLLFHKNPRSVVNVGHGGGYTLKTITLYPGIESIDNVEIDKVIIAADKYVTDNGDPLSDPRVKLVIADARNYLFATPKQYDVIMTEASHVWANPYFFTKEFYQIAEKRLNEGGVYSIWLPFYEMTEYDYATVLNTIRSAFPYIAQFYLRDTGAVIILASASQLDIPDGLVLERLEVPAIRANLDMVKQLSKKMGVSNESFIKGLYYSNEAVEQQLAAIAGTVEAINTDDLPLLEFNTLRNRYSKFRKD